MKIYSNLKTIYNFAIFMAVFCFFLFFIQTNISYSSDFHSPRTDALGGAGHAGPLLSDSIYLNPSFTPFTQTHSLSFNYLTYSGGLINTPAGLSNYYGNNMNLSVMDGTSETIFQAGVGYTRRDDVSLIHVGAAKHFFQRLGVGVGAKFIFPNNYSGNNFTDTLISTTGVITSWFQIAFIADNLLESGANFGFFREYIIGTKINIQGIAAFYVDPHWIPTLPLELSSNKGPWGFEAGAEFTFMSDFFLRLGAFQNSTIPFQNQKGDGLGIGVGWLGPKLSLDYGFSKVNIPIASYSHQIGATLFF